MHLSILRRHPRYIVPCYRRAGFAGAALLATLVPRGLVLGRGLGLAGAPGRVRGPGVAGAVALTEGGGRVDGRERGWLTPGGAAVYFFRKSTSELQGPHGR